MYNKITMGFVRMGHCMDNTIQRDNSAKENLDRVCKYPTHCARNGITFNEKKFCFDTKEVEYLRF